ncbi:UDP-N-acetylmuramoyl-L-alanyl-D-glutamate--2,6-diaminopimelate ligase [Vibrio rumoiensis]|uniref:UDP-N-acetylmuramoyl-L-alanyl-D-glutamate--2,6-diaminopimelate ligase n=1 Tax=Vibrio rumoiensis 1S-45 TaxID=1188252 RepID=A0A1E5E1F8_9VIBR|nr:UDP-N-acetylmuramoyl-L-alanyl-D-glutamate--2,6-diaminopimelate ligase [Vibrio rumoiensis]OEF24983.1 UDP-N-acetylmuramoyl-L-alanyl-D-glutamate--2,6-diaminopimelate ligase [Vibrio rumoiensis 1S-45]
MTLTLTRLLQPWVEVVLSASQDVMVNQLQLDSRQISSGDIFVAIQGHEIDGRRFIDAAISLGAAGVIADADDIHPHGFVDVKNNVAVVYVEEIGQQLSALAQQLYQHSPMKLIGITGTNGKTTISQLIAQWIDLVGRKAAVMGTTGNGFLNDLQPAVNTTGNAIEIQQTLSALNQKGADFTALEISSHGLVQGRVKTLCFAAAAFTNLSRDHLDYHGSMEAYANAKLSLFTQHDCQHRIINRDDPIGQQWLEMLPDAVAASLSPFDLKTNQIAIWAKQVTYSEAGIQIELDGAWGQAKLQTPLIGAFNASNVMVALATLLSLNFTLNDLVAVADKLTPVIGRMELFQSAQAQGVKAKIVVDYAHTPDALEKALLALRVHCKGKLWSIFGCGGDRDSGKRPMMAEISERLADESIITDDNPRSEDPKLIVADMLAGPKHPERLHVIHSRFQACEYALQHAGEHDIILLAGKGHEDYQIIADQKLHYSDRETAQALLG